MSRQPAGRAGACEKWKIALGRFVKSRHMAETARAAYFFKLLLISRVCEWMNGCECSPATFCSAHSVAYSKPGALWTVSRAHYTGSTEGVVHAVNHIRELLRALCPHFIYSRQSCVLIILAARIHHCVLGLCAAKLISATHAVPLFSNSIHYFTMRRAAPQQVHSPPRIYHNERVPCSEIQSKHIIQVNFMHCLNFSWVRERWFNNQ